MTVESADSVDMQCVRSSAREVFPEKACGKGNVSENYNAALELCYNCDHDAVNISSGDKMYPTAIIWYI
jgi:uncharacterized protein (DUF983 family)